jgi:hypothetical protein
MFQLFVNISTQINRLPGKVTVKILCMFQLFVNITTHINGLPGKVNVRILSTGSLALTKPRMVVEHLWFQPREVKQSATILPVFLGPNRSLLSNTMYSIKPCCHNILYIVTVQSKTAVWKLWNLTQERKTVGCLMIGEL